MIVLKETVQNVLGILILPTQPLPKYTSWLTTI